MKVMDGFGAKPATWCYVYPCVALCCVYLTKARVDYLMVRGPLGSKWSHWLKPALGMGPLLSKMQMLRFTPVQ